ncbi:MAG: UvrD-helicase domain-containing protein [Candidatus Doudnabacteria bacterium]|nr:UvrD-helicase domain-containing protein [Candidatus Doudnabacteria bacterium]
MDLSSLNEKQKEAVTAPMGAVLLLAGPGSGKTKTLTNRIAYIIEKKMVKPENILALTFTNKAAKEMRERVGKLLVGHKAASDSLTMGTFHAVCAKILRHEIQALGYGNNFVIFDSDDQQKTIKEILEDLRIDSKKLPAQMFGALISRGKNLLQTPGELNLGLDSPLKEHVAEVYARYQDALFKQNALDFDDLLMLTVKIFENYPKILTKYQKKFTYILVDEYQDTNQAQYLLLSMLATSRNIFVVGDDAQSIYKFRGSDITNILNFEKDYPEALVIKLEQNYRSTKNILEAAQKVIELNPEQKPKTLWTENPQGEKIILTCEQDERGEAEFVAKTIVQLAGHEEKELEYKAEEAPKKGYSILDRFIMAKRMQAKYSENFTLGRGVLPQLPKQHDPLTEYCILYRTHAQSRSIEEALIEASIPYQIVGGLKFYDRKEIKDMLAYLRLVVNYRDLVSLKRVINEPPRGLGDKSYAVIRDFILNLNSGGKEFGLKDFRTAFAEVKLQPKAYNSAIEFFAVLEELADFNDQFGLPELMRLITRRTGYERYVKDGSEKGDSRWENVEELINVAHKFKNLPWRQALQDFLEEVALLAEIDQKDDARDVVTLMTLHSAKGLEFDNVFFVGLEEGILPHSRSLINPDELSEEVRLAYVGLTRARKRLFLIYTQNRRVFGNLQINQPSRILKVLPKTAVEFKGLAKDHFKEVEQGELTVEPMEF